MAFAVIQKGKTDKRLQARQPHLKPIQGSLSALGKSVCVVSVLLSLWDRLNFILLQEDPTITQRPGPKRQKT